FSTSPILPETDERLRLVLGQMPAILWTTDLEMRFTSSTGAGLTKLGLVPNQVVGQSLHEFFGTDDPDFLAIRCTREALAGQSIAFEQEVGGRVFQSHVEPLRDAGRRVVGTIGVALDITYRKHVEEDLQRAHDTLEFRVRERTMELRATNESLMREIEDRERAETQLREREQHFKDMAEYNDRLLQELHHRVRNNLAGLMGLISLMRERKPDVDTFAKAIESRLMAMAHVHRLLADAGWHPVDLAHLLRSLLAAVCDLASHRIPVHIEGPPAVVHTQHTLPLAMTMIEWFTNSCKYGAHSVPGGRVDVTWTVEPAGDAGQIVRLRWRESGGPRVRAPIKTSLGTELVQRFVTQEMEGRSEMSFPETGVDHTIEFVAG
ncbi:MAG: HWE histidine kinase domain-containing protein, partial [Tepidisphaeraceae bacterium]